MSILVGGVVAASVFGREVARGLRWSCILSERRVVRGGVGFRAGVGAGCFGIDGLAGVGEADAAAGSGIGLDGIGEMADEQIADVGESCGATGGNFSGGEEAKEALQGVVDAARLTETKSLIGEEELEIVFGLLGENVAAAETAVGIHDLRAAAAAGFGVIFAASEGDEF